MEMKNHAIDFAYFRRISVCEQEIAKGRFVKGNYEAMKAIVWRAKMISGYQFAPMPAWGDRIFDEVVTIKGKRQ